MPETASGSDRRTGSHLVATALMQEMQRDERIVVFGEDVGALGGVFGATRRLQREFGSSRVFDTPISETAFVGMAIGAAQAGLRPVVEIMFVDFIGVCFDQVLNQMAKNHYMSGGRVTVPLVLRSAVGSIGSAAQHSQILSATFAHIPGIKVLFPGTPGDLAGLLVAAIRSDDPVIFLEHKWLLKERLIEFPFNDAGLPEVPIEPSPIGKVRRIREGSDVSVITSGWMVQQAMVAAEELESAGISAGVVDIRSLVPLDRDGLAEEALRAPFALVVDEDFFGFGTSSEVMASLAERIPGEVRMARHALEVPQPAAKVLEERVVPSAGSIARHAMRLVGT